MTKFPKVSKWNGVIVESVVKALITIAIGYAASIVGTQVTGVSYSKLVWPVTFLVLALILWRLEGAILKFLRTIFPTNSDLAKAKSICNKVEAIRSLLVHEPSDFDEQSLNDWLAICEAGLKGQGMVRESKAMRQSVDGAGWTAKKTALRKFLTSLAGSIEFDTSTEVESSTDDDE